MSSVHIPAWKRLGLKLKSAQDTSPPTEDTQQNEHEAVSKKRKRDAAGTASKASRKGKDPTEGVNGAHNDRPVVKEPKEDVKEVNGTHEKQPARESNKPTPKTRKKEKKAKRQKDEATSEDPPKVNSKSKAALDYLQQHLDSYDTWKFNKAKQNYVIKNIFNLALIPEDYTKALVGYIKGLQGDHVRQMVKQASAESRFVGAGEQAPEFKEALASTFEMIRSTGLAAVDVKARELSDEKLQRDLWVRRRAELFLLALGELDPAPETTPGKQQAPQLSNKKRKKQRTAAVDISSSDETSSSGTSSDESSSSSESSSDSEVANHGVKRKRLPFKNLSKTESGSSSDTSSDPTSSDSSSEETSKSD